MDESSPTRQVQTLGADYNEGTLPQQHTLADYLARSHSCNPVFGKHESEFSRMEHKDHH